jgi:8-oxo-dGTP pyrophosphatase MutT (NUDIX family)
MLKKFNIRVYGLLIEDQNILVVDEIVRGNFVTKFPGGGLELGEGPVDCVVREFREEAGFDVEVSEHFYTTDFFQQSLFNPEDQLISIYYKVKRKSDFNSNHTLPVNEKEIVLSFRWLPLKDFKAEDVSLPIDKVVAKMLADAFFKKHPRVEK